MFGRDSRDKVDVQYLGIEGISLACQHAVIQVLQYGWQIEEARLLSSSGQHCFLLMLEQGQRVAIRSGFSSGYPGEGPRTLSYVLTLLHSHDIDIEEYRVPFTMLKRLDKGALTLTDISELESMPPVRPMRWYDYVYDQHWTMRDKKTLWHEFPPVIPYRIIDPRLMDLALSFWDGPDDKLLTAYRRLEDTVRKRTDSPKHGVELLRQAFLGDKAVLVWPNLDGGEQTGRAQLFMNAFLAYRNPRAHREETHSPAELLNEFLLVNHLYRLEASTDLQSDEEAK